MGSIYRNRFIFNQRGGSLTIDNTTNEEKVKLSHRSGSNISLNNVVNSELASNNKQTLVVNDSFETVSNDKNQFIGKDFISRVGQTTYNFNGFIDKSELDVFKAWKKLYEPIAKKNSQFRINRGGIGVPKGDATKLEGSRDSNPTLKNKLFVVNNTFNGYKPDPPIRNKTQDDVTFYVKVIDRGVIIPASEASPTVSDITEAAGSSGSKAPGVLEFGSEKSAATENGTWGKNTIHLPSSTSSNWSDSKPCGNIDDPSCWDQNDILNITKSGGGSENSSTTNLGVDINETHKSALVLLEKEMGTGGDDISLLKRHKYHQIGAVFNDFPSVRIDPKGRSQPLEIVVSKTGAFKNQDYFPHIEEVDNSSNFPCGNDDKIVGNRYTRTVGSGGIQLKSTGNMELAGTILKTGFTRVHINASHGIVIGSENGIELQSIKTITLRTDRQVYVEGALGVRNNLIVGGGAYVEGELYCHHITAPLEVHQTEDTTLFGKFATDTPRNLVIGETKIGDNWYPVFALEKDNLIMNYPHSHHHNGIPMRLTKSNSDVRKFSSNENINKHTSVASSLPLVHERKRPKTAS